MRYKAEVLSYHDGRSRLFLTKKGTKNWIRENIRVEHLTAVVVDKWLHKMWCVRDAWKFINVYIEMNGNTRIQYHTPLPEDNYNF